jgi:hypothetical protein
VCRLFALQRQRIPMTECYAVRCAVRVESSQVQASRGAAAAVGVLPGCAEFAGAQIAAVERALAEAHTHLHIAGAGAVAVDAVGKFERLEQEHVLLVVVAEARAGGDAVLAVLHAREAKVQAAGNRSGVWSPFWCESQGGSWEFWQRGTYFVLAFQSRDF